MRGLECSQDPWAKLVGKSGVEFVKGFLEQQRLSLTGYRVDDVKLLAPGDYVVEFEGKSQDKQGGGALRGSLAVLR